MFYLSSISAKYAYLERVVSSEIQFAPYSWQPRRSLLHVIRSNGIARGKRGTDSAKKTRRLEARGFQSRFDSIHTYRYFLNRSSFPCSTTIGRNCGNITIPNYCTRRRREGERRCRREGGREGRERERSIAEIRERMRWKSERRREIGERATHQPRFLPVNYRSRSSSSSDSIYGAASAAAQKTADRCQIFRQCPEDGLFIYQTATKIGRANRRGKFHVSSLSRSTLRVSFYSLRSDHR